MRRTPSRSVLAILAFALIAAKAWGLAQPAAAQAAPYAAAAATDHAVLHVSRPGQAQWVRADLRPDPWGDIHVFGFPPDAGFASAAPERAGAAPSAALAAAPSPPPRRGMRAREPPGA